MGIIHRFPASQSLDPADLEIAAAIYADVVKQLALPIEDEASRERIAQRIIEKMLLGERDPIRLRDGALAWLTCGSNGDST